MLERLEFQDFFEVRFQILQKRIKEGFLIFLSAKRNSNHLQTFTSDNNSLKFRVLQEIRWNNNMLYRVVLLSFRCMTSFLWAAPLLSLPPWPRTHRAPSVTQKIKLYYKH